MLEKSKAFALRIIKLYKYLPDSQNIYALANQVLKSETSIGANVKEAIRGQSKADFYAKLGISLKEADETAYWLEKADTSRKSNSTVFMMIVRK